MCLVARWLGHAQRYDKTKNALEKKLLSNSGITLNEYYVLYFLDKMDSKKMRLNDLEKLLGLSQSAVSRMIFRLENKNCGVIARFTCPEDRRGIYIGLTRKGEQKLKTGKKIVDQVLGDYFSDGQ